MSSPSASECISLHIPTCERQAVFLHQQPILLALAVYLAGVSAAENVPHTGLLVAILH